MGERGTIEGTVENVVFQNEENGYAIAMESRCYHGGEGRTRMKHLQMQGIDWAALITGAVFLAGIIVLKKFGL